MTQDLVLDPFAGLSGDMWLGLLCDLGADPAALAAGLAGLPLPPWRLAADPVRRGALKATQARVLLPPEPQPHRHLGEIERIVAGHGLPPAVEARALAAFRTLAAAEARIHGVPVERVHFHEVGALDTIVDVCGTLLALEALGVASVWTLPVAVGGGFVRCSHGLLPVPAPAAAELLAGFPLRPGPVERECATPTGAVLLKLLARPLPPEATFTPERVGYGAGADERPEALDLLRGWLARVEGTGGGEALWEVQVELDDVTGEVAGYALERLLAAGAADAWITPVQMKKGRPGLLISALADEGALAAVEGVLLGETPTLGLRRHRVWRTRLPRRVAPRETSLGPVRCKVRTLPGGREEWSVEQDEAARVARERGLSLLEVLARLQGELG